MKRLLEKLSKRERKKRPYQIGEDLGDSRTDRSEGNENLAHKISPFDAVRERSRRDTQTSTTAVHGSTENLLPRALVVHNRDSSDRLSLSRAAPEAPHEQLSQREKYRLRMKGVLSSEKRQDSHDQVYWSNESLVDSASSGRR